MKNSTENNNVYVNIKDWIRKLDATNQDKLLASIDEGLKTFIEYLEDNHPKIKPSIIELLDYMEKELKRKDDEQVIAELEQKGLTDSLFVSRLIPQVMQSLRIYFDSDILRQIDLDKFKLVLSTVIGDIFVKKKYRSMKRLDERLNFNDEAETKKIFQVLRSLIRSFYFQNVSYEDLEKLLLEDLEFERDKIECFISIMEDNSEKLERYFIFENISKFTRFIDKLQSLSEESAATEYQD